MEGCLLPSSSAAAAAFDAVERRSKSRPKRSAFILEKNTKIVLKLKVFFTKNYLNAATVAIAPRREGSNKMSTPFDSATVRVGRCGEKGFVRGMKAGSRWQGNRHSRQLKKKELFFFLGGGIGHVAKTVPLSYRQSFNSHLTHRKKMGLPRRQN